MVKEERPLVRPAVEPGQAEMAYAGLQAADGFQQAFLQTGKILPYPICAMPSAVTYRQRLGKSVIEKVFILSAISLMYVGAKFHTAVRLEMAQQQMHSVPLGQASLPQLFGLLHLIDPPAYPHLPQQGVAHVPQNHLHRIVLLPYFSGRADPLE